MMALYADFNLLKFPDKAAIAPSCITSRLLNLHAPSKWLASGSPDDTCKRLLTPAPRKSS
jgi:hypothetical protein